MAMLMDVSSRTHTSSIDCATTSVHYNHMVGGMPHLGHVMMCILLHLCNMGESATNN